MGGRLLRSLFGLALLLAGLIAVASSFTGVGVPTTYHTDQLPGGVESYRGRRAVDESTQCVYVASLKTSMDSGNVGLKGSVVAYNESGLAVATFTSMPLAVAVDPVSYSLFVSTPINIQQYDISANLKSGQQSCPCSFSTLAVGESVIQTMAVDQKKERLYFATHSTVCWRLISGSEISCQSYDTSGYTFNQIYIPPHANRMFITMNDVSSVYVISLALDSTYLNLETVWTPLNSSEFIGITSGSSGNLFLLTRMEVGQPCAAIEVDVNNGSVVACFNPPLARRTFFQANYGLLYNNATDLFYTFIASENANTTMGNSSTGTYDIQMFDLQPSATIPGQLENTVISYLVFNISSPVDGTLGPCPRPASPSPSPQIKSAGSDVNAVAIAVPVAIGSTLLFVLAAFLVGAACWVMGKRRRKYFDSTDGAGDGDPEDPAGVEMDSHKFTFREIDGKDLRLGKLLGEGAFGKVYKGEYRGAVVAVKMFEALRLDQADEKVLNELRTEAQMMDRLSNHPGIVKFVGAITKGDDGANFALVTEFCVRGSLYDLLVKNKKKLPLITLVRMARDAASGILHLHKEHIVHRDIAARNILVGQNYEVYVSDFGLARAQAAEGQVATTKQNFGPLAWMAPEALKSREYSEATDAFSFGVLLWEMMARKRPWAGVEPVQIITSVTSNTRLRIPKDCDPIFAQLMKMCWRQNPSQRPSFDKVADVLSNYYKKLHKLHDISADAFEISDQESEGDSEDEMALEGLSYEEWQMKRIKDEVKSFMKQLITERNDDFTLVARANAVAFTELKEAFDGVGSEEESSDDSDESYDSSGDDDDGDEHDERHPDKKKQKQKDYLENELLFAESGEVGRDPPDVTAGAAAQQPLPVSHYVEVQQPRSPPVTRTPTISYAELGRSPSTGGEASPLAGSPAGSSVVPSSDHAVLASTSQRRANKRTKARTKTKETTKAMGDGDHPAQTQQLPASQYVDLGLKKKVGGPPPEQQPPLPQDKSQVFDSAYITLEPRNAADPTITMTAKDWKERVQREGSGSAESSGRAAGNGYEEITTPAGEAIGHRPHDAGYYGL